MHRYIKRKERQMFIVRSHSFNTGNRLVSTVYSPIFLQLTVICYSQLQILYIPTISCLFLLLSSCSSWNKQKYVYLFFPLRRIPNCRFEGSTRSIIDSFFFFLARGKWEPLAGYLRHLVLPRCSIAARPRTRVSGHVFQRHLTRVFNATGHGISAWTRPRA